VVSSVAVNRFKAHLFVAGLCTVLALFIAALVEPLRLATLSQLICGRRCRLWRLLELFRAHRLQGARSGTEVLRGRVSVKLRVTLLACLLFLTLEADLSHTALLRGKTYRERLLTVSPVTGRVQSHKPRRDGLLRLDLCVRADVESLGQTVNALLRQILRLLVCRPSRPRLLIAFALGYVCLHRVSSCLLLLLLQL